MKELEALKNKFLKLYYASGPIVQGTMVDKLLSCVRPEDAVWIISDTIAGFHVPCEIGGRCQKHDANDGTDESAAKPSSRASSGKAKATRRKSATVAQARGSSRSSTKPARKRNAARSIKSDR